MYEKQQIIKHQTSNIIIQQKWIILGWLQFYTVNKHTKIIELKD